MFERTGHAMVGIQQICDDTERLSNLPQRLTWDQGPRPRMNVLPINAWCAALLSSRLSCYTVHKR
jgi:hypothetical protein